MRRRKPKKQFVNSWIFESFDRDPTFFEKPMFGCLAAYLRGRMVLVLAENPGEKSYRGKSYDFDLWDGMLLPTERCFHESLKREFEGLVEHPVLGKWLYFPARHDDFESAARDFGRLIDEGDERFGIDPSLEKKRVNRE